MPFQHIPKSWRELDLKFLYSVFVAKKTYMYNKIQQLRDHLDNLEKKAEKKCSQYLTRKLICDNFYRQIAKWIARNAMYI